MNKRIILFFILSLSVIAVPAQKNRKPVTGKAMLFSFSYNKPVRKEFDTYLRSLQTALGLQGDIRPELNPGVGAGFLARGKKAEFEGAGAYYMGIRNEISNPAKTVNAALSTRTFDIHFGVNRYLGRSFYLGCGLGLINNGGQLDVEGAPVGTIESTPEKSNPFKGYSWSLKPAAGFFFPIGDNDVYSGLRLSAYYDFGFSSYEFYKNDIFNNRLAGYSGAHKSSFTNLGIQLGIVIGFND